METSVHPGGTRRGDEILALQLFGAHVAREILRERSWALAVLEAKLAAWLRSPDGPTGISSSALALVRAFVEVHAATEVPGESERDSLQATAARRHESAADPLAALRQRVAHVNEMSLRSGARRNGFADRDDPS